MPLLKNLVFDLGGVLFAIDPSRTDAALQALRRADAGPPDMPAAQMLFDQLETGLVGSACFQAWPAPDLGAGCR